MPKYIAANMSDGIRNWLSNNRRTFDIIPHLVFVKDCGSNYIYMNHKFLEYFPTDVDNEVLTDYDLFPDHLATRFQASDRALCSQKGSDIYEAEISLNENNRYFQVAKSLIYCNDEVLGILGIGVDISEKITAIKREQEALNELQTGLNQFEKLVENAPFGILISHENEVIFVNSSFCEMIGRDPRDVYQINSGELWGEAILERLRGEHASGEYELTLEGRDGEKIPILLIVKHIHIPAYENHVSLSYIHDLRDRKERERLASLIESRANQKSRIESLGNLAAGLAHEINNFMTPITGFASLLAQTDDDGSKEYLDSILVAANDIKNLTSSILNFAGLDEPEEKQLIDLADLISDSQIIFDTISQKIKYSYRPTAKVLAKSREIRQVIFNLLLNAEEASSRDREFIQPIELEVGTKEVTNRKIETNYFFGDVRPGYFQYISVRNNGKRIPEETLNRVFDPYFTTKEFGKGMGLAFCLGIVRSHDGMIGVVSDDYTEFAVYLPRSSQSTLNNEKQKDISQDRPDISDMRIMVVDDNEQIRTTITRMLELDRISVLQAHDRDEAIKLLKKHADVNKLIMDINMPGMTIEKFSEKMHAIRGDDIPTVIFTSGFIDPERLEEIKQYYPKFSFIAKPFEIDELKKNL